MIDIFECDQLFFFFLLHLLLYIKQCSFGKIHKYKIILLKKITSELEMIKFI